MDNVSTDMSFLEMLDILNDKLEREAKEPVIFDHDCREGICMCSLFINGKPHGPEKQQLLVSFTCELSKTVKQSLLNLGEPLLSVVRDLRVDRSAFDRLAVIHQQRPVCS